MQYGIVPEYQPNGENTAWFECDPSEAEAWSVWTVEDGEAMELLSMFETKEEAEDFLENILIN